MMKFLGKLEKPYVFSSSARKKMFCASILIAVLNVVLCYTYRPYIYSHKIFDFHIADSFTDFLAVPASMLLCCAIDSKVKIRIEAGVVLLVITFILYEFIGKTFDYYDMIAAVISGFPTTYIMRKVFPDWR